DRIHCCIAILIRPRVLLAFESAKPLWSSRHPTDDQRSQFEGGRMLKSIVRSGLIVALVGCFCTIGNAQEVSFTTADGQTVNLSSLRGKVVVMLFSGSQDPQCREGIKALEQLSDRYQGKNVAVYWVSINSPAEMTDQQLKQPCGVATSVPTLRD